MRCKLKPAGIEGVYAVKLLNIQRWGYLGWLQRFPSGWSRFGYDDNGSIHRSLGDAVSDLIAYDRYEQDTADWPK